MTTETDNYNNILNDMTTTYALQNFGTVSENAM